MNRARAMYRFMTFLCVLSVSIPAGIAGQEVQYSEQAEAVFKDGVSLFSATMYREAIAAFDRIIRDYPSCQRITAAYVMKGKSLYSIRENLDCAKTLKEFLAKYPASLYVPDAELTLGLVYNRIGRYNEALEEYLLGWGALPRHPSQKLLRELAAAVDTIISAHATLESVQRLLAASGRPDQRAFFWTKIAQKEIAAGDLAAATVALDTLTIRYSGLGDLRQIADLRSQIAQHSGIKIGALMPLMRNSPPSGIKEIGSDVYDGIVAAFEQYGKDSSPHVKVVLETRDTERDARLAGQYAQQLAADSEVIGIIGPVFSMNAQAAVTAANAQRIPIVTPTANANGIAATGPYAFQANPDYEMRGEAMAQYAIVTRGFRTVAVMAPSDSYGKYLAEGFVKRANRLGATVVATEWYEHGAADLKAQLGNIRRAGMMLQAAPLVSFAGKLDMSMLMKLMDAGVPKNRLDSLASSGGSVSVTALLGPKGRTIADSLGIKTVSDETNVDSLQYPVESVQCLYVPISSAEEIGVVSSQVVYFNFHTQLLGSGEWNDIGELSANARYCNGVIFDSDFLVDTSNGSYNSFVAEYTGRFKKRPSRNTLYGYDTAALMLSLIRNGAATRESLTRALTGVDSYQGLHTKIGFTLRRVNNWLSILQYDHDRIRPLDEVRVND